MSYVPLVWMKHKETFVPASLVKKQAGVVDEKLDQVERKQHSAQILIEELVVQGFLSGRKGNRHTRNRDSLDP